MAKKSFDSGVPVDELDIDAADLAGQIFENKDDQAEAEFGAEPWEFFKDDEVTFELNGVELQGVISFFRATPLKDLSSSSSYVMDILVKNPASEPGRVPMLTCSLDDLKEDKYKVKKK